MHYTSNYGLPLYDASDIANYLDTYNNTITEIDTAIHNAMTKAESGELHGTELDKEIESLTSRVAMLETSLSDTIENVSTLSSTVSGHTQELAKVTEDLLAQNTLVKSLSNSLTELSNNFSSFKSTQENFNNEISAKVGNWYFKAHKYDVPSDPNYGDYTTEFTIDTDLGGDDKFTKSHVMLEFMQSMVTTKKASAILNCDFSTTDKVIDLTADSVTYNVRIAFDSYRGFITITITGRKEEAGGTLYANATVYTD